MTIQEYFGDWVKVINIAEADRILKQLVALKQPVCPSIKDIFRAFTLCSLYNLKVVILAQDPYFEIKNNSPVATGIAFGNSIDTPSSRYSPSLEILSESVIDFSVPHKDIIFDPSLEKWENQGVLMLNSALSCIAYKPGSHTLLWRPFIRSLLCSLSAQNTGIVYVLMGNQAQSFEPYINEHYNYILKERHPAWYARNHIVMPSDIWYRINDILVGLYGYGIEWYKTITV